MATVTLEQILETLPQLEKRELAQINDTVRKLLTPVYPPSTPEEQAKVIRVLEEAGLLLPKPETLPYPVRDFTPVTVKGEPMSETIIRDRGE